MVSFAGTYILMMFYTTVARWMIALCIQNGDRPAHGTRRIRFRKRIGALPSRRFPRCSPTPFKCCSDGHYLRHRLFFIVGLGLQNGVERVTKVMMACLFVAIVILAINSVMLPGAQAGLEFYLMPDFGKMIENGFGDAACRHGPGILHAFHRRFGHGDFRQLHRPRPSPDGRSGKRRRPFHAHLAARGLDYFPRLLRLWRFARFGSQPGIRRAAERIRPNVGGQLWGTLFFIFMSFAALLHRHWRVPKTSWRSAWTNGGVSRRSAVAINAVLIIVLSVPCILGFNVWQGVQFPGIGTFRAWKISLSRITCFRWAAWCMYCSARAATAGAGRISLTEANTGAGPRFPKWAHAWIAYGIPVLMVVIFIMGYIPKFQIWFGL